MRRFGAAVAMAAWVLAGCGTTSPAPQPPVAPAAEPVATGPFAGLDEAVDAVLQQPFAWINGPYTDRIGEQVTLDGSGSYAVSGSITDRWDFDGDGVVDQTTSSSSVTHRWPASYDGVVTLTVDDSEGGSAVATTHVGITRDGDEIADETDTCPNTENQGQEDTDVDGRGDACDSTPGFPTADLPGVYEGSDSDR